MNSVPQAIQSLLETPEALLGTVWSRQDYRGIIIRNRLFVINGYSYTPPLRGRRATDDESPRIWVSGYTIYEDGEGNPRPFSMLLDSLRDGERFRPTDLTIDPRVGRPPKMKITVIDNTRRVKRRKSPEVEVVHLELKDA